MSSTGRDAQIAVAIAGATGSVGRQTIEVIERAPDRFRVSSLSANRSAVELAGLANRVRPDSVGLADSTRLADLTEAMEFDCEVAVGEQAAADVIEGADIVVNGVVGFAGLVVTQAALEANIRLALANKESLVAAGPALAELRRRSTAEILPVDSEHHAIHQCLRAGGENRSSVSELVLTASGGPFRNHDAAQLEAVTIDDALNHPTWSMGPKITVDSSTLMNKGLEVIEAYELFGIDFDRIRVVVHPQSVVHSMVTYRDGSTVAQLSMPDMRLPVAYCLAYPERFPSAFGPIDWAELGPLEFMSPDTSRFPCLDLAYHAGREGQTAPAWLNAANETAVDGFLQGRITWMEIAQVIENSLDLWDGAGANQLEDIIEADRRSREVTLSVMP